MTSPVISQVMRELSPASPLLSLLLKMKGQIDAQSDANSAYEALYPALEEFLMKGYRFESQEIQGMVKILGSLPAWGARRENFKRHYLSDESGLRKLPRNPRDIPAGMWH
ncbi:hypothetical protein [Vibrio fluvialis]|uniref:hypothetical protein n=1 Tax=Vibrio fluvialis TaxID=676 RepID=UPI0013025137|nr:hypothetical protein [Vibrio fluvialis]